MRILVLCSVSLLLTACSGNAEEERARKDFVLGCTMSGAPKDLCDCTFDRLLDKYSVREMSSMGAGGGGGMMEMETLKAMTVCAEE